MIDRVFIINLKHREDRKSRILKELENQKIENYEFFEGIVPDLEKVNSWNINFCRHIKPRDVRNFKKYKTGCLGCLLSHLEIMKMSLERGYENVLILEDDCIFEKEYQDMLVSLKKFNKPYNLLYLSGSHLGEKTKIIENIYKITKTITTGSYIVNREVMKFIIENITGFSKEVDVFYSEIVQQKFDCYGFFPRITKQDSGFSDIQQTVVSYMLK
jgi:glycosyl transferase family 25